VANEASSGARTWLDDQQEKSGAVNLGPIVGVDLNL